MTNTSVLILHDIRSTHNVGSLFRIADCAGISKIFIGGFTASPVDRFGREQKDIAKAALGAEKIIPYERYENLDALFEKLKQENFFIVAIEQDEKSIDYKKVEKEIENYFKKTETKIAFLLGTEVTGIPKPVLEKCDCIAEIPMRGEKESLNVSVAAGIAIFRILGI